MQPKPIQPKRADFPSFEEYFDAMIQYHLELSKHHLENVQSFLGFDHPDHTNVSETKEHSVCKICTSSAECNLKRSAAKDRQKICLILRDQARAAGSPQYYTGTIRLPEQRSVWHKRLESFLQDHTQ